MNFLKNVYSLQFNQLASLATGEALLQAAVLEGRTELLDESGRSAYLTKEITITHSQVSPDGLSATMAYQARFADGRTLDNQIDLVRTKRRWQVARVHQPLIRGNIYDY